MSRSRLLGQSLAVPALIVAVGVLWMYCSGFLAADLRQLGMSKPFAAPTAAIASLLVLLLAPALPLASLFRHRAALAATAVGWPPLALALALESSTFERSLTAIVLGTAAWAAVILGAWLASRRWPPPHLRDQTPFEGKNAA